MKSRRNLMGLMNKQLGKKEGELENAKGELKKLKSILAYVKNADF